MTGRGEVGGGSGAAADRPLRRLERALRRLPASRDLLPEGDFRDWQAVDDWATRIARRLQDIASSS